MGWGASIDLGAGKGMRRVTFTSDVADAVFTVWVDGVLWSRGSLGEAVVPVEENATVEVDVFDDLSVPGIRYPARAVLVWEAVSGVETWVVEQSTDRSTWTEVMRRGAVGGIERFISSRLADGTYYFRVKGRTQAGFESRFVERVVRIVRRPDKPAVPGVAVDGGAVTLS